MSKNNNILPKDFQDLEVYVPDWALDTERERKEKRASSDMPSITGYYSALLPRVEAVAAYLDGFPMGVLEIPQQKLLNLALMFMEVSIAVEFYKQPELPGGFPRDRFEISVL